MDYLHHLQNLISQPFTWGLVIGLALFIWSGFCHFKTKRELTRYKGLLGQKLELESRSQEHMRKEIEDLKGTNENLRFKVNQLKGKPGQSQQQELEIMARSERQLMVSAPGFAAAWEQAKTRAREEIESEEADKSRPRQIFQQIMGRSPKQIPLNDNEAPSVDESASEHGRASIFEKGKS